MIKVLNRLFNKNSFFFNKIVTIFFLIYLVVGLSVFSSYGVSTDEETQRLTALTNGNYILQKLLNVNQYNKIFNNITKDKFEEKIKIKYPKNLHEYPDKTYGVIFELPVTAIEIILNIKETKNIYLLRHLINFIFFYISLIFFFKLLNKIFKNKIYSLFGCISLIFLPRIFADIFYNSKDIIFLSFFIISNYYGYSLLLKIKNKNLFLFSFFSACAINIRPIALVIPLAFILLLFLLNFFKKKEYYKNCLLILILTLIFLFIVTPFLWEETITNFVYTLKYFKNHPWPHYNFYFGEHIKATKNPWHYIFTWILITTPLFHLITIFIGLVVFILKFKSLSNINKFYIPAIFFFYLFMPVFLAIVFNATLYDGLRHFYFLFPFLIIFQIIGISYIFLLTNKKNILLICIVVFLLSISSLIKLHPYQYLYFNNFFFKNPNIQFFEKDYWAISNKQVLDEFLKRTNENKIVYNYIGSSLPLSIQFLDEKHKKKFIFYKDVNKNYNGPVYFFVNNRYEINYNIIKSNSDTVYEFIYNNVIINGVYKYKNINLLKY